METQYKLILILLPTSFSLLIILFFIIVLLRKRPTKDEPAEMESGFETKQIGDAETEVLIRFQCAEDLTVHDILDAPGEVIGKSSYGTLYRASLIRVNSLVVLRFLRPACTGGMKEVVPLIQVLGSIRHDNLVPLKAFYGGPRGEKLLVHPFYGRGNLAQFIRDGNGDSRRWDIINKISIGIARGLDHLHAGLQKPIIHGNLKSKNIFLDRNYHPYISDFGIHLLLNPTSGQEMLDLSASQGYKAPELIKMRDASEETDIYSLGVILLEFLTGKEPINENPTLDEDFYLPNAMRNAILEHRIMDLYHPDILLGQSSDQIPVIEERILDFFQLAMACCSPSPSLRPHIKQVLGKFEEIGKWDLDFSEGRHGADEGHLRQLM